MRVEYREEGAVQERTRRGPRDAVSLVAHPYMGCAHRCTFGYFRQRVASKQLVA
ncbi:MAG TPA: hypothetical protein VI409_09300 [Gaiellaceae bacterium]|nr:hypothetical protein [Gaiellaceae bacterium]